MTQTVAMRDGSDPSASAPRPGCSRPARVVDCGQHLTDKRRDYQNMEAATVTDQSVHLTSPGNIENPLIVRAGQPLYPAFKHNR